MFRFRVACFLLSANAFHLDKSENLLFGKDITPRVPFNENQNFIYFTLCQTTNFRLFQTETL